MKITRLIGTGTLARITRFFRLFPYGIQLFIMYSLIRRALTRGDRIAGVLAAVLGVFWLIILAYALYRRWQRRRPGPGRSV